MNNSKIKPNRKNKQYLLCLPEEEYELWKSLCNSLNIRYSHRVLMLIREDTKNLLSLVEILKKKKV